jgi:hypothetical protein
LHTSHVLLQSACDGYEMVFELILLDTSIHAHYPPL